MAEYSWLCEDIEMLITYATDGYIKAVLNQALNAIRKLSADVQPIRHGRWIWDNDAIDWGLGAWVCSECHGRNENIHAGKPGYDHTIGMSPYHWAGSAFCPNCGCAMGDA